MPLPVEIAELPVQGPPEDAVPSDPRGRWPRMLVLDKDMEVSLSNWLADEIYFARLEKRDVIEDWKKWQEQYWAVPESPVKNFPFERSANIVIPLTAIAVEAVVARLMNTIFAVEPFWSIRPRNRAWAEVAKPTENWLQSEVENSNSLDVFTFCSDTLTELAKLGTCIGKSGYVRNIKKSLVPTPEGTEEEVIVETKNGATLDYVPIANFLVRVADTDPQEAAWCGEEHIFTWGKLKEFARSGRMIPEAVESIKTWKNQTIAATESGEGLEYKEKLDELQDTEPIWHERFKVQEVWASFDVDKDGWDEEVVIDFHKESRTILSIRYNWYRDLHRPYRVAQYYKVEGRIWGVGIGKQNEQFQTAITTVNRQRIDNATLSNMRMLAVKKQSGITPDEPIFPGKLWFVDDPKNDVQPLQMSEIYSSQFNNEAALLQYSERRTGVNEVILGLPHQGTPGTATGDLARLSEGNKRFDLVLRNVRHWLGDLGLDALANYQQFGNRQRHWLVLGEKGEWVERLLTLPTALVREGAVVELTATDSTANRETEQQQWLSLLTVLERHYDRLIALAQLLQDPQILLESAIRAARAGDEAMKHLLRTFRVPDAERLLFLEEEERRMIDERSTGAASRGAEPVSPGRLSRIPEGAVEQGLADLVGGAEGLGGNGGTGDVLRGLAGRSI